jgi:hypothetical protein
MGMLRHVDERFEGEIGYSLYQLNHFYVEVKYNGGINAITKFAREPLFIMSRALIKGVQPN